MERLALLWDELDDLVVTGARLAAGAALALADTASHLLRRGDSPATTAHPGRYEE
jgi:hypothetical protein